MCTVQVLLFADVTRPSFDRSSSNALRPGLPPRNVCRRLFVDENEQPRPSNLLKTLEADLERQVKERWNFDFRTGKPLPGRYQWVNARPELSEASNVPQQQSSDSVPQKTSSDVVRKLSDRNGRTSSSNKRTPAKSHLKSRNSQSKTQTKITDFLQQRKRPVSDVAFSPKIKSRRLQVDRAATSH